MFSCFKNKTGFGLVGVLIVVCIIAALLYGGAFFWKKNTNTRMDANDTNMIGTYKQAQADIGNINRNLQKENAAVNDASGNGSGTATAGNKITVNDISAGATLTSPVTITGTAAAAALVVELRNSEHSAMVKEPVTVRNKVFSISLSFEFSSTKDGYVAVYSQDQNGAPVDLVEIPVKFGVAD